MNLVKLEQITDMLQKQIEWGLVKGNAAYVLKNGHPIYKACCGMADEARGIKWTEDTIVRLYSMTKPITAAAAMILFDRGQLDLQDKVADYIPGFKDQKVWTEDGLVPVQKPVTIKNLLDMTSGLCYPDGWFPAGAEMQKLYDRLDAEYKAGNPSDTLTYANLIGQQPLAFQPGEKWMYGTSADILGAVIEVVSGKKFGDFLKDELFEPLGMVDTDFYVPEEKLCRFAENYEPKEDGSLVPCLWQHLGLTYLCRKMPEFQSGGAGLCSTMNDYAAFATMLLNKGTYHGRRILSENAVRYLTSPQLTDKQQSELTWDSMIGYNYGNLMRICKDERDGAGISCFKGEYGWDGWLGCFFANDPQNGYTFLYFIQRCGGLGQRPIRMIKQIVYGAEN
ncbi:MAG: beta-lactamase family protein [Oscillospiraceae bacterium]|nr:beta-lactamase family protein [Oscillospiraceae bacterium]